MAEKPSSKKSKIFIEEIKQLPPLFFLGLINRAKKHLKDDEVMRRVFEDYDIDIEEIDLIPITFADLDVSAKTDHGIVYLNYKLLCDGDFLKDYSYLIHEITHSLQQTTGSKPTQGADDGNYLENPFEQEGFQNQIEYIAKEDGPKEAEEYVENLLDHHDVKSPKKKDELEAILLENV